MKKAAQPKAPFARPRLAWIVVPVAALLLAAGLFFLLRSPRPEYDCILLVTLDTTRADHVGGAGRTPAFARLAAEATTFSQAHAPVPLTLPSHCTIMTGLQPPGHGVRNNDTYVLPEAVDTLAEILKRQGYQTAAFVSSFTVTARFGLHQGFDHFDDTLTDAIQPGSSQWIERRAGRTAAACQRWLDQAGESRWFCWLHFFDPHLPYDPPEPQRSRFAAAPYAGEIAFMDEQLGWILDRLRAGKRWQRTLVVVAGDHGEAFGEHGEIGHQLFCYQETLHVPLLVKSGVGRGRRSDQPVSLADVAPTILEMAGIPVPGGMQGVSLDPLVRGRDMAARPIYFESLFSSENLQCAPLTGIIQEGHKYIHLPRAELYDLAVDPGERDNLLQKKPLLARKLKISLAEQDKLLQRRLDGTRREGGGDWRALAALGYLASTGAAPPTGERPDPKQMAPAFLEFNRGVMAEQLGQRQEAAERYRQAIDMGLSFPPVYLTLANLYHTLGRGEDTRSLLAEARRRFPHDDNIRIGLATLLIRLNRLDEAGRLLEEARELPATQEMQRLQLRAEIAERRGDGATAIAHLQELFQRDESQLAIGKWLAKLLVANQRFAEAHQVLQALRPRFPGDSDLLHGLGVTLGQLGEFAAAAECFERVLPVVPAAAMDFAALLARQGDWRGALDKVERFLRQAPADDPRRLEAERLVIALRARI